MRWLEWEMGFNSEGRRRGEFISKHEAAEGRSSCCQRHALRASTFSGADLPQPHLQHHHLRERCGPPERISHFSKRNVGKQAHMSTGEQAEVRGETSLLPPLPKKVKTGRRMGNPNRIPEGQWWSRGNLRTVLSGSPSRFSRPHSKFLFTASYTIQEINVRI